jgi:hypothetical protein
LDQFFFEIGFKVDEILDLDAKFRYLRNAAAHKFESTPAAHAILAIQDEKDRNLFSRLYQDVFQENPETLTFGGN